MPIEEQQLNESIQKVEKSIKLKMIEKDYSQAELAKMLGATRAAINAAVSGSYTPQSRRLRKKIYKILGMDGE